MQRRAFLSSVVTASVAAWFPVPKWIGESAGGLSVPIPADLESIVDWHHTVSPFNYEGNITHLMAAAIWAPIGSRDGVVQLFAGTVIGPMSDRQRENAENSMRACLEASHDPGWLKVHETYETDEPQGYDDDGEPYYYTSRNVWKRIGYLQWIKPSMLPRYPMRIASA